MFVQELAKGWEDMMNPPGIPWAELEDSGHGIEVNGYDPAYMDLMLKAYAPFMRVVGTLDIEKQFRTMEAADGRSAITRMYQALDDAGGQIWTSLKQGDLGTAI